MPKNNHKTKGKNDDMARALHFDKKLQFKLVIRQGRLSFHMGGREKRRAIFKEFVVAQIAGS
jgi:hypothetical protein